MALHFSPEALAGRRARTVEATPRTLCRRLPGVDGFGVADVGQHCGVQLLPVSHQLVLDQGAELGEIHQRLPNVGLW